MRLSRTTFVLAFLALVISSVYSYSVVGNQLYGPDGNKILLRGMARPSLEWNSAGQHLSLSDYQIMKNVWGCNVIRVDLNQNYLLSGASGYNATYLLGIDQQVTWIKSLGMGVILDLHWADQDGLGNSAGAWAMADQYSVQFWQQIAAKYANDPWIMFELYNEPFTTSWSVWQNGGSTNGFTAVGYQQLVNAVRGANANNVVIIGGIYYAYDLSQVLNYPITGSNIMYNTHPYNNDPIRLGTANWDSYFGYLVSHYPVIMTEFGCLSCTCTSDYSFVAQLLNYTNAKGIHFTGWGWFLPYDQPDCNFPSIISTWQGDTFQYGGLVKDAILANPLPGPTRATAATVSVSSTTTASSTTKSGSTTGSATSASSTSNSNSGAAASSTTTTSTGSITTSTTSPCNVGSERCLCTVGGSCNKGLTCLSGYCVNAVADVVQSSATSSVPQIGMILLALVSAAVFWC